jgi:hypothetical protein
MDRLSSARTDPAAIDPLYRRIEGWFAFWPARQHGFESLV